jgi:PPK2 family polyphosphate:nucleotide phosphotransferase
MWKIEPGQAVDLKRLDGASRAGAPAGDETLQHATEALKEEMADLQRKLWAQGERSLLVVLQAMDAGGKDGTIRKVLSGMNPQGVRVVSFKEPTDEELAHDFLWRIHEHAPAKGEIAVFNRSHYEDVVAVRVRKLVTPKVYKARYEHIRAFERLLEDNGTTVVKLFLHITKAEQHKRFEERRTQPDKQWKYAASDLEDRSRWNVYMKAYGDAMRETSTASAPWWVVPADHKKHRNWAVATILTEALRSLRPAWPDPPERLPDAG